MRKTIPFIWITHIYKLLMKYVLMFSNYRFLSDKESFNNADFKFKRLLYIFACANSFMNPLVYGFFNLRQSRQSPNTRVSFRYTSLTYSHSFEFNVYQFLNYNLNHFHSYFLSFLEHDNTSNNSRFSLSYEYSDDNLHAYAKKSNSC